MVRTFYKDINTVVKLLFIIHALDTESTKKGGCAAWRF